MNILKKASRDASHGRDMVKKNKNYVFPYIIMPVNG